jgi:hypothetical protein
VFLAGVGESSSLARRRGQGTFDQGIKRFGVLNASVATLGGALQLSRKWDLHSKEAVTVTVSEQRGSEQAGKRSEATEKKTEPTRKSSGPESAEATSEDISRLLLQVQELLMEHLPRGEDVGEEDLTAEDVASYAKVRAFLSARRQGGLGALIENLEDALSVIAEARDEIDTYLEAIDLDLEGGRASRRIIARR